MCKTAHIGMMDGAVPYVVPLSYGYELEGQTLTLFFHCASEGRKIDILKKNPCVCFEMCNEGEPVFMDAPCNSGYYYSSIIGNGTVEFINRPEDKCHALTAMFFQQSGKEVIFTKEQAANVLCFKVTLETYSAKRKPKR